jgi:hypothetical protein
MTDTTARAWLLVWSAGFWENSGGEGTVGTQVSPRYGHDLATGDQVFIYRNGADPALVAAGTVATPTDVPAPDLDSACCGIFMRVEVTIHPLVPVAAATLLADPATKNLPVFARGERGTVFPLTPGQAEALSLFR